MLEFLSANWVWILFVGAVLWMMVGHGGHGGCGGGRQHSTPEQAGHSDLRQHEHHGRTGTKSP